MDDCIMFLKSLDVIGLVKTFAIGLFSYGMSLKIINKTLESKIKKLISYFYIGLIACLIYYLKYKFNFNFIIIMINMIILLSILLTFSVKYKHLNAIIITLVSISINYIIFYISSTIMYLVCFLLKIKDERITFTFIIITHFLILNKIIKIKRIKNGFSFLYINLDNDYFKIAFFNISSIILFMVLLIINYSKGITENNGIAFIIFSIIMFLTIKKSIETYYKQKLLIQDLNETKKELENKKREIEELETENLRFSKKSHSLAHKQKSLEFKINKLLMNSENAKELGLQDDLKKISEQLNENSKLPQLDKTGITEVDDMLNVMQEECRLNNIDFILQLNGNIYQMTNNYISKEELGILLADHIKDAIIAINHSDNINKSIMVRLGKIEECFAVYIYDSGIEFPKNVLEKLGKVPITTYPDEGGTGMGFMNTFDLIKKCNASLIIESIGKPSKDNYTKVIKIKFDNKNQIYV